MGLAEDLAMVILGLFAGSGILIGLLAAAVVASTATTRPVEGGRGEEELLLDRALGVGFAEA